MSYGHAPAGWRVLKVSLLSVGLLLLPGCGSSARSPAAPAGGTELPFRVQSTIEPEIVAIDRAVAPLSLTATDGTGLRLVALQARAVVESPLAFTELHLTFENPEPRTLEGRFQITLPPQASLSRFAMRIGEEWQEGEVLEKRRATAVYEDFLHRKQDPALLEQAAGNEFAARVFPIPPRGRKELVLSYSEELVGEQPYRLALAGLPEIERLDAEVHVRGQGTGKASYQRVNARPAGDLVIARRALGGHAGVRAGDAAVLRVKPVGASPEPAPLGSTLVLFDTSASRVLGFGEQLQLLYRLAREVAIDPRARLVVACFDQETKVAFDGRATEFDRDVITYIEQRGALGASDLGGALTWASEQARLRGLRRLVVVSDAVATVGGATDDATRSADGKLRASGLERLDFILVGGIRDEDRARHLARMLPRAGVVVTGETSWSELARRLTQQTHSGLKVAVEGARWVWPATLDGVQAGDEVLVTAELPRGMPARVTVGGRSAATPLVLEGNPPLIERAAARARIASLLEEERTRGRSEALERRIVKLSERHRVLSPYTALLVLETQADYDRFHIERGALKNILVVQNGAIAATERAPAAPVASSPTVILREDSVRPRWPSWPKGPFTPPPPAAAPKDAPSGRGNMWGDAIGDAFGAGGLGLTGIGEGGGGTGEGGGLGSAGAAGHSAGGAADGQGFGSGHGRLGGSHRTRAPRIRMGTASVSGRLPPEVIQRVVRQSYGRMRMCYEQGLRANPNLEGRVVARFVIARDGSVTALSSAGSDLPSVPIVACIVELFRTMTFPAPEGGAVTVTYPFMFSPSDRSPTGGGTGEQDWAGAPPGPEPWTGLFAELMAELAGGKTREGLERARKWRAEQPGELLALVALGEALTRSGDKSGAARAYGSLIDLYSFRADLRRYAAARLEALGTPAALELAIDDLRHAVAQRPDHPSSHRALGMALLRAGRAEKAFDALLVGYARSYPDGRFAGAKRVLGEDLALAAAVWMKQAPARKQEIRARLEGLSLKAEDQPSLRFVLSWETDSNDVDFHIYDDRGGHAYYQRPELPARGGDLYADVTTGYGPECFTIRAEKAARARYRLFAHYYSRGPMGYGLGKVQVIDHDGAGGLVFDERPFVVMQDGAYVRLGEVKG